MSEIIASEPVKTYHRHVWIMFVALVLMNAIDMLYTYSAFARGYAEDNIVMASLYQQWGYYGMIGFKVIVLSALGVMLRHVAASWIGRAGLALVFVIYFALTLYHFYNRGI